ncbi:hypothetical protein PMAYCL1PPCAC_33519 [Pristionchus mayeri]|uniref:AMP-dependent synthetase/ligase domain-containing protein n=1 Tax=Pristionchus mayeri TaxID=1317129 RepID=A0AAN5DJ02_9BILA|nr:hypothetical protein PMAYCL1PPCAC_33519 [Pristionchus mayeri]
MDPLPLIVPVEPFHVQLLKSCERYGNDVALTDSETERSLTFRDVHLLSVRMATEFKKIGVEKGEIVLCALPNCLEYPLIFLGLAMNGAVLSGVPHDLKQYELSEYLRQTRSRFLVACKDQSELVQGLDHVKVIFAESLFDSLDNSDVPLPESDFVHDATIGPDSILLAPFSSGTTGTPKCALLTHENYSAATASLKAYSIYETKKYKFRVNGTFKNYTA